MSEEEKTIRKAFTVITSPVWVPIAAVGGAIHGIGEGVKKSNDLTKKEGFVGVLKTPFVTAANIVTGPFKGIVKVGESMYGDDEKK